MKNMEKELLCPVCQEMYKQPLVLPCTHNVCQACAREVLGQQGYVGHGGDPSSEPTSPASTPSTRSPRLSRRTLPKPDRLDRLLKSGGAGACGVGGEDAGMSIRNLEGVHPSSGASVFPGVEIPLIQALRARLSYGIIKINF